MQFVYIHAHALLSQQFSDFVVSPNISVVALPSREAPYAAVSPEKQITVLLTLFFTPLLTMGELQVNEVLTTRQLPS